ncbi:MAG TPA: hypothetical protein DD649_16020 [Providencia sp.]|uniref:hypothetical protein n=1 Tax=Providencia sp. TaxID=589 RepID=UPI000E8D53CB|nr:hypothetical protein [Providencia sp.]MBP6081486.1 hypothetical protein [Providencia sp.]HBO24373.1 hypothetical protein [Providencia sp.]
MSLNNYIINLSVEFNNAPADGINSNVVNVICMNSIDNSPAIGVDIVFSTFSIKNSAFISESGSSVYSTVTDITGKASANICDTLVEDVLARCHIKSDFTNQDTVLLTFRKVTEKFAITNASNINRTFLAGEPTIAWSGAEFTLYTKGGSGDVEWSFEQNTPAVTLRPGAKGVAYILIKNDPSKEVRIIAKDKLTGEIDSYFFYLSNFVRSDRQKHTFFMANVGLGKFMLPVVVYQQIFSQWGDLTYYFIWSEAVDTPYWTNEEARVLVEKEGMGTDNFTTEHVVFDVRTGVTSTSPDGTTYEKYFMHNLSFKPSELE